jgi:zinc transport system substrate-binding protein
MKRFLIILALSLFVSTSGSAWAADKKDDTLRIVCTTAPQYDWVRQILGKADDVDVTLLLDSGVDLHSYQPSVDDVVKISASDLFIYVGGESDEWVEDALKEAANKGMVAINLLDTLGAGAKLEDIVEGMEDDESHGHEAVHEHEGEEEAYDEHVWLSLKNAGVLCAAITDALAALDADNARTYQRNLEAYQEKLSALDAEYQAAVSAAPGKTLLFGDRFPFRYLADDYGLTYYAAFPGCSAETEASFETIVFLAGKVDELGLKAVMALESSDQSIADTIISNTKAKNQRVIVLGSMQSVTLNDIRQGTSYFSVMEGNLKALKEALR